ncbi:Tryptophan synthase alpha chain [Desulfurella amilsii]|uniref:tryptophan synthase n=1 Tax=Desulfurella amilsii TaxID=1562698 RepID=A0A1X4XW50_9BACT|nr:tryptophan synthase subunit alpha [Desulfurella amilsii]OSS41754.1 Tryptophan synthase alpha chain [Desulfurella amilsii]
MNIGIYLISNYPKKSTFLEAVEICNSLDVDFLEIGIPFSDPIADGAVLEKASFEMLDKYTTRDFLESLFEVKRLFQKRLYIMTYTNIPYSLKDEFNKYSKLASGVILADLPVREAIGFEKKLGCNIIKFATPESRSSDLDLAIKSTKDFIYFISKRGITGGDFALDSQTVQKINYCKKHTKVYLGFGIRNANDIAKAFSISDGVIIGTQAAIELQKGVQDFERFIKSLKLINL